MPLVFDGNRVPSDETGGWYVIKMVGSWSSLYAALAIGTGGRVEKSCPVFRPGIYLRMEGQSVVVELEMECVIFQHLKMVHLQGGIL